MLDVRQTLRQDLDVGSRPSKTRHGSKVTIMGQQFGECDTVAWWDNEDDSKAEGQLGKWILVKITKV